MMKTLYSITLLSSLSDSCKFCVDNELTCYSSDLKKILKKRWNGGEWYIRVDGNNIGENRIMNYIDCVE